MNWLLTAVLCAVLVEVALRLPFGAAIAGVRTASGKALRVVVAKAVSDHWKEKAMGAYARMTFVSSIKLAAVLVVVLLVAATLVVAFDLAFGGFQDFILGWRGIGFSVVFATVYFVARRKVLGVRI